jgi:hypothetical protein
MNEGDYIALTPSLSCGSKQVAGVSFSGFTSQNVAFKDNMAGGIILTGRSVKAIPRVQERR